MKKIITIAVILILVLGYGGCKKDKAAPAESTTTTEDSIDTSEENAETSDFEWIGLKEYKEGQKYKYYLINFK